MGILSGYNEQFKTFTDVQAKAATDTSTKSGECFVYFIQATNSKFIKIGYSQNPSSRLAQLQTANFDKLVLLGTVKGDSSLEKKLHDELAAHRVAGTEWFAPHENVDKCVSRYLAKTRPPRIYFAGKVNPGKSDYRAKFFDVRTPFEKTQDIPMSKGVETLMSVDNFTCVYTGPFVFSWLQETLDQLPSSHVTNETSPYWDYKEYIHGPNTHGLALGLERLIGPPPDKGGLLEIKGLSWGHRKSRELLQSSGNHEPWGTLEMRRRSVWRCLKQIESSDIVHAFIESLDCYGTIAEIGYASSKGKPVFLFADPRIDIGDLWFMAHMPYVRLCESSEYKDARSYIEEEFLPVAISSDEYQDCKM